jgi:osmotically-inducible protein OsmY
LRDRGSSPPTRLAGPACVSALERLIWDARIRSTHLHVKVAHGHLTLTGHVREEVESDAATEDVATVTGVVGVINRLEIR